MATAQEAVRRLKIEVTTTGADQAAAKLEKVSAQQSSMAVTATGATKATGQLEAQLAGSLARYDAIIRQQAEYNRALAANVVAANDNSRSISESGLKLAEWTNHVKTAGEAAYALSPKFRGLVNSMAVPALSAATTGIELAAAGVVRGTNLAGKGLIELGAGVGRASSSLTPFGGAIATTGAAMAAWNPTIASVASSILGKLIPALRLLSTVVLVYDAIKMVGEAWELGGQKLEEYRQIAEKAAAVDLSTSYFQKLIKGAKDSKSSVDDLTKALTNLQASSADELGGSALQQRLKASVKAGNFKGNTGVAEFAAANTTEEKYKAIASLIRQAMQDGQRLAALDISKTAFGPEVTARLRQDSEYFDKINAAAAKVSEKDIVSDADVGRALDLQKRYEAAVAILEQRWRPIQDLLTIAGVKMQEAWVSIVESAAKAVDYMTTLVTKILATDWKDITGFFNTVQKGANAAGKAITEATTTPESRKAAEAYYGISSDPAEMAKGTDAYADAVNRLRAGLQNQFGVQQKVNEANAVANKVLGDSSHTIDDNKKKREEAIEAVDRAINSVTRHIELQKADAQAVGLGDAALASFRVQAAETAAVLANGGKETAEQAAAFAKLKVEAGAAAEALARAKVDNTISRGRQTSLLSPEDVQIANQLKGIYPDVATALGSVEASALRTNQALSTISSSMSSTLVTGLSDIFDGTKSVSQGFSDMSRVIVRAIEEAIVKMMIVAPIMRGLQSLMGGFLGGGATTAPYGAITLGGASGPTPFADGGFTGAGSKYEPKGVVHAGEFVFNQDAVKRIGVENLEAMHRNLRGYDVGGLVLPSPNVTPFYNPANSNAPSQGKTEVHIHGATNAGQVKVQESTDGRGNRRVDVVLAEMTAQGFGTPGSPTQKMLASQGVKPPLIRR